MSSTASIAKPRASVTVRSFNIVTSSSVAKPRIPVIVVSFNLVTYVRNTVDQLLKLNVDPSDIMILDNRSTYPPMLEYLNEIEGKGVRVKRYDENMGSRVLWRNPDLIREHFSDCEAFVLTDPDLQFHPEMPSTFREDLLRIMRALQTKTEVHLVGAALDLSDSDKFKTWPPPFGYLNGCSVSEWESQFWKQMVELEMSGLRVACPEGKTGETCEACAWPPPVYVAAVDTTFGLYDSNHWLDASEPKERATFRVAGRFTAKHLPWYDPDKSDYVRPSTEEQNFYNRVADPKSSSTKLADAHVALAISRQSQK